MTGQRRADHGSGPPGPGRSKVVLVGGMGAGKSTVGRLAADLLGWPYRDNDASLQERSGRTAAQIADADGLAALHELERQVLDELLDEPGPAVVAAPASVATFADSPRLRARAFVVWLRASPEILAERASSGVHRPMPADDPAQLFARLADERAAFFTGVADLTIDTARTAPAVAASALVDAFRADAARTHASGGP